MKYLIGFCWVNLLVFFLVGCSIKTQTYHSSADNMMELKKYSTKVRVGNFTTTKEEEKHIVVD